MKTREQEVSVDADFARHVREGLAGKSKRLDPRYFYDEAGSRLFEEICRQPEYYPTRTEAFILQEQAADIISEAGEGRIALVEFGSGSSTKTKILIKEILARQGTLHYFPIDISLSVLIEASARLEKEFSGLKVRQVHSDYAAGIDHIEKAEGRKIILFLGSSIGNFEPAGALAFLSDVAGRMQESDLLLVGFDLQKDAQTLNNAYNDKKGVTARFNKNVLARINRELGGEFDLSGFDHKAVYDEKKGRIEMHLVSRKDQDVRVKHAGRFHFARGESIHTESSYKYTTDQIEELAQKAGLEARRHFTDRNRWFDLALLAPSQRRI
jgi:dimethylhistidine N-methyltransferase